MVAVGVAVGVVVAVAVGVGVGVVVVVAVAVGVGVGVGVVVVVAVAVGVGVVVVVAVGVGVVVAVGVVVVVAVGVGVVVAVGVAMTLDERIAKRKAEVFLLSSEYIEASDWELCRMSAKRRPKVVHVYRRRGGLSCTGINLGNPENLEDKDTKYLGPYFPRGPVVAERWELRGADGSISYKEKVDAMAGKARYDSVGIPVRIVHITTRKVCR